MVIAILIVFSLVYSIGFITPMNSDDYTYALRELSLSSVKNALFGMERKGCVRYDQHISIKVFSPRIFTMQ